MQYSERAFFLVLESEEKLEPQPEEKLEPQTEEKLESSTQPQTVKEEEKSRGIFGSKRRVRWNAKKPSDWTNMLNFWLDPVVDYV